MTWRTIIVRERAKLDYSLNFMTVRKEAETRKISLSENSRKYSGISHRWTSQ